jgi:hypothetical protein
MVDTLDLQFICPRFLGLSGAEHSLGCGAFVR